MFGKAQDSGKVMYVDESDYNTHQIFFEDVENCVDVRDLVTGKSIPREKVENMYVVRVQPQKTIIDGDFFTGQIKIAEELRDEEIERVEQALDQHEEHKAAGEDWIKLQQSSNEEYLMKTVLPVLYQGMKVVDLQRPNKPLEYLALYLLKHQDKVKLPHKPTEAELGINSTALANNSKT